MTRTPRARPVRVALAAFTALVVSGCAGLPDDGAVHVGEGESPSTSAAPFDFNPPGPPADGSKEQVVAGFLRALQATPATTEQAKEFLSSEAAASWRPDHGTIVYGQHTLSTQGSHVRVAFDRSFELDRSGRWLGTGPAPGRDTRGAATSLRLRLVDEKGQWRISNPPDAMVVPQSHFESRYREYSLYFFDPTGSVLVPEPVYLPWGVQSPTLLVKALLAGPTAGNRAVERTFFPSSTRLGLSVPVGEDGVAEVPLTGGDLDLDPDQLSLALAQLAWTLRQVEDVSAFRVSVDGVPMEVPGTTSTVDVGGWDELSPTIASASTDLFGLRHRSVVQVVGGSQIEAAPVPDVGPVRSLGVDLASQRFALVSGDGERVLLLPRSGSEPVRAVTAYSGTDVLRPMWDRTGRLWLVDRTAVGARVLVGHRGRLHRLTAPGLDGQDVVATALSRDGTRMVAAVLDPGGGGTTELLVMRVVREGSGAPVSLTPARVVGTPEPLRGVRGVGWRDPTTVAVLTRPSGTTSQVVLVACDGSSELATFDAAVDVLYDKGVALATSPGGPEALFVVTRAGQLDGLDVQGRWDLDTVEPRLVAPTFVG